MSSSHVVAYICTKGRYDTTLPSAMISLALQSRTPQEFVLYDDNSSSDRKDLRSLETYRYIFQIFDEKKITWKVIYGSGRGQHYGHQTIQKMSKDICFRVDDDCILESNVLELLLLQMRSDVGAVGGSILTPPVLSIVPSNASSRIDDLDKPNKQWFKFTKTEEVDHLHCSFLYRAGIVDYDLRLSKKAHREETEFTYALKCKGYKILITPCVTWHLKSQTGGIRSDNDINDYQRDEFLFQKWLNYKKSGLKLYVNTGGLGDNYAMMQALYIVPGTSVVATCYPEMYNKAGIQTFSIDDAKNIMDIDKFDVYKFCGERDWQGTLIDAYKAMYKELYP